VVDPVSTSQRFFRVTSHFRSISISEMYHDISAAILQTAPDRSTSIGSDQIVPICAFLIGLLMVTALLVNRMDLSEQGSND
jgi:hypothetical protein